MEDNYILLNIVGSPRRVSFTVNGEEVGMMYLEPDLQPCWEMWRYFGTFNNQSISINLRTNDFYKALNLLLTRHKRYKPFKELRATKATREMLEKLKKRQISSFIN